jgi:hypothetical protein
MSLLNELISCFGCSLSFSKPDPLSHDQITAKRLIATMYRSEKSGADLTNQLRGIVQSTSWSFYLGEHMLTELSARIARNDAMPEGLAALLDRVVAVVDEVGGFVRDHPVFFTLLALGILVLVMPEVIGWLGFGELGPVEGMSSVWRLWRDLLTDIGSYAAWWESAYAGFIPKGSLFSFFQRLGMKWRY